MIDESFLRRTNAFVQVVPTGGEKITPEQNLLQELITSACLACHLYLKTGKIHSLQGDKALAEFTWNINALRVVDEEMLVTAGFRHRRKIGALIGDLIAEGDKMTNKEKEVSVCA